MVYSHAGEPPLFCEPKPNVLDPAVSKNPRKWRQRNERRHSRRAELRKAHGGQSSWEVPQLSERPDVDAAGKDDGSSCGLKESTLHLSSAPSRDDTLSHLSVKELKGRLAESGARLPPGPAERPELEEILRRAEELRENITVERVPQQQQKQQPVQKDQQTVTSPPQQVEKPEPVGGQMMPGGYYRRGTEEIHRDAQRSHHARLTGPFVRLPRSAKDEEELPPLEPPEPTEATPPTAAASKAKALIGGEASKEAARRPQELQEQQKKEEEKRRKEAELRERRRHVEELVRLRRLEEEVKQKAVQEEEARSKQLEEMAVMARRRRRGLGSDGTQPVVTAEEQSVVDPGEKAKQEEEEQRRRREEQEKAKELRRKERAARDAEEDNRLRELRHKRREAEEAACLQRERQAAVREQIRFAREAAEAELRAAKSEDAEESTGAGQNSEQQQQQESVCQEASALEVETSPGNNNNSNSNNNNQDAAPQKLADREQAEQHSVAQASSNNNNNDDDNSAHPDPAKSAASAVVESPGEDLAAAAEEKLRKKRQQEADVAEKKREAELQRKNKKESEEKAAKAKKLASETVATEESDVLKSQVNVAVLGHEGAGKTSLCAAILHASGALNDRDLAKFRKELAAGLVEGEEVRREEGAQTRSARLTLLDVPGSRRCLPQAVQAAAEADVALVVVSAKGRELEGALKDTGGGTSSLLEQLRIASGLGARRLLVAVTKMDEVKWAQDRFAAVVALLTPLLEHTGFKQDQVAFVPVSGLSAELDCKKAPWHTSGKLLDCLDAATSSCESRSGPLRVLVFEASKGTSGGLKVLGRVEQGVAAKGQSCVLSIGQLPCVIEAVTAGNVHSPSLLEARGGDTVELQLSGGPWAELPPGAWRGAVLAGAEAPVRAVSRFKASMDVLENPKIPMTAGFKCVLHLHAATVEAEILKIVDSTDLKSGAVVEKPKVVRAGQRLTVLLELSREVALELPAASEAPGRLALLVLRSGETTVAIGHAIDLPHAEK